MITIVCNIKHFFLIRDLFPIQTYLSDGEITLALKLRYVRELCHATHTTYLLLIYLRHVSLSHGNVAIITTVLLIL